MDPRDLSIQANLDALEQNNLQDDTTSMLTEETANLIDKLRGVSEGTKENEGEVELADKLSELAQPAIKQLAMKQKKSVGEVLSDPTNLAMISNIVVPDKTIKDSLVAHLTAQAKKDHEENVLLAKAFAAQASALDRKMLRADSRETRSKFRDEAAFVRFMQQASVTGRGTKRMRDLREQAETAELLEARIKALREGALIGDFETAVEISNGVSRLISGGVPAQGLVHDTLYKSFPGDKDRIAQYVSGHPMEYISSVQLDQIEGQLANISENKKRQYRRLKTELKGSVDFILKRRPYLNKEFEAWHPDLKGVHGVEKPIFGPKKQSGRTPEQEARYQELLRKKRGG